MRSQKENRTVGLAVLTVALCSACATGSESAGFADGAAEDSANVDGTTEAETDGSGRGADDSATRADDGAPDTSPAGDSSPPDDATTTQDSTWPIAEGGDASATADSMAPDTGHPMDASATDTGLADSGQADTGLADTGSADTGPLDSATAASVCSVGPGAAFQLTCSGCSISAVLSCASCTKKDQTQNSNPSLQLPCPGSMSVQNSDGVLSCSGTAADTGASDSCSVGPGADYQASCSGCAIGAVLSCASCTKEDQSQNQNPKLQLPCPGTMSVQNVNGVLVCM